MYQEGEWNDKIDALEDTYGEQYDALCEQGYDMASYVRDKIILPQIAQAEQDPNEIACKRTADAYLDAVRPTKKMRGNETEFVNLGADGHVTDVTADEALADVDVLEDVSDGENDTVPDKLAVYSEADDSKGILVPAVFKDTGALWTDGFRFSPEALAVMKPHQMRLAERIVTNIYIDRGMLAAHTMGLGKSLSLLIAVDVYTRRFPGTKTVLICPKAMVKPWQDELYKWGNIVSLDIFHVSSTDPVGIKRSTRAWEKHGGILVLGHDQFRMIQSHLPIDEQSIFVVDEAHLLKSSSTRLYKAVYSIVTPKRVFLTGTPLQNHLEEYYHMMTLLAPGLLGDSVSDFRRLYGNDIEKGMMSASTKDQIQLSEQRVQVLRWMVEEYMDDESLALLRDAIPAKTEFCIRHPCLDVDTSLNPLSLRHEVHEKSRPFKLCVISLLIRTIQANTDEDIVIFSSRNDMLQGVHDLFGGLMYTGKTGDDARSKILEDFQQQGGLLLVATKAGGVGLNLTRASRVIICDVAWNPVEDTQAVSRAWRMGQTRPVFVYRLVADDTLEAAVYNLNLHKYMLAARVMDEQDVNRLYSSTDLSDTNSCALPVLDMASISASDDVMLAVMGQLGNGYCVTSHTSLFLETDATLSLAEQSDAKDEYNTLIASKPRTLESADGTVHIVLPDQIYFPNGSELVQAHPPSVEKRISHGVQDDDGTVKMVYNLVIENRGPAEDFEIRYREVNDDEWDSVNKPDDVQYCTIDDFDMRGVFEFQVRSVDKAEDGSIITGPWSESSAPVIVA